MKNTFGTSLTVTLFGESHGAEIGAVIDGLAPGIPVDEDWIASQLTLRRPAGRISTARQEADAFRIVSGVFNGRTTGTPVAILIPNADTRSGDYQRGPARPGHADLTAWAKYHGYEDYRGGGHFSGRITAALVAAGAIAIAALRQKGIVIGTHIARCAGIDDAPFTDLSADLSRLNSMPFAVLDEARGQAMREAVEKQPRSATASAASWKRLSPDCPRASANPGSIPWKACSPMRSFPFPPSRAWNSATALPLQT